MTPEGRVKKMVKKALDTLGADCYRFMPVQTGFGSPTLDYLLCVKGAFVSVETKAPRKKLTPLQEGTKAAMEAAGGLVFVIDSEESLQLCLTRLKQLGGLTPRPDGRSPTRGSRDGARTIRPTLTTACNETPPSTCANSSTMRTTESAER